MVKITRPSRRISGGLLIFDFLYFIFYFSAERKRSTTRIFGNMLSPGKFSARNNLTSELLRFL